MLMGCTSPFMLKALPNWPHVLHLSSDASLKFTTTHKPILRPDKEVISFLSSTTLALSVKCAIARAHFLKRTIEFIGPLERYFQQLVQTATKSASVFKPPRLAKFSEPEFFEWLDQEFSAYDNAAARKKELHKKVCCRFSRMRS